MFSVDIWRGQHVGDRLRIGRLVRIVKTFEDKLRGLARHGKTLCNRRALRERSRKIVLHPHRRKIDAAIMEEIGIDQSRDQAKRQVTAIDGMDRKQRPAGLKLEGPKSVEFERGASVGKRCIGKLRWRMKAERRSRVA